jgi:hypothetical protein
MRARQANPPRKADLHRFELQDCSHNLRRSVDCTEAPFKGTAAEQVSSSSFRTLPCCPRCLPDPGGGGSPCSRLCQLCPRGALLALSALAGGFFDFPSSAATRDRERIDCENRCECGRSGGRKPLSLATQELIRCKAAGADGWTDGCGQCRPTNSRWRRQSRAWMPSVHPKSPRAGQLT